MGVLTLPRAVQNSKSFSWSPYIDAVLFATDTHLTLCRQSGRQVWNSHLRKNTKLLNFAWSPDGLHIAAVYSDGCYQILNVSNGRPVGTFTEDNASCVTWTATNAVKRQDAVASLMSSSESYNGIGKLNKPAMAVGKNDGTLQISMFDILTVSDIPLGLNEPVAKVYVDGLGTYASIIGGNMVVLRIEVESKRLEMLSVETARAAMLLETLASQIERYTNEVSELGKHNAQFNMPDRERICELFLTGHALDTSVSEWIQSQHETGFKRWYKALTSSFDNIRKIFVDGIVPIVQSLLLSVGELSGICDDRFGTQREIIADAAKMCRDLLAQVCKAITVPTEKARKFENFAKRLESTFTEEIDRPINVARKSEFEELLVFDYLDDETEFVDLETSFHALNQKFSAAISQTCDMLKTQVTPLYTVQLPEGELRDVAVVDNVWRLLYEDKLVSVSDGQIKSEIPLEGSSYAFVDPGSKKCILACLDQNNLVMLSVEEDQVSTVYSEEVSDLSSPGCFALQGRKVCVLSSDLHHYIFSELPKG